MPNRKPRPSPAAATPAAGVGAGDTLSALAHSVRSARQRRGWSLATLAARSGLSKGMLLQIEGARTNPSIATLIHIANAFGVSVWQLFAQPEDAIRVARPDQALRLWKSKRGGTATLLVGAASPQPVELWEWQLAPGDVYHAEAHFATTMEVIHVKQGTLTLVVGKERAEVAAGGSVVSRMDRRHQYRNDTRAWVKMTMVVIDPKA